MSVLIFVTVMLGIIASYQLLVGLLSPDASVVRRRMSEEFQKDQGGKSPARRCSGAWTA
jgi:hypothetical protein